MRKDLHIGKNTACVQEQPLCASVLPRCVCGGLMVEEAGHPNPVTQPHAVMRPPALMLMQTAAYCGLPPGLASVA